MNTSIVILYWWFLREWEICSWRFELWGSGGTRREIKEEYFVGVRTLKGSTNEQLLVSGSLNVKPLGCVCVCFLLMKGGMWHVKRVPPPQTHPAGTRTKTRRFTPHSAQLQRHRTWKRHTSRTTDASLRYYLWNCKWRLKTFC